jgi:hypothetical protein
MGACGGPLMHAMMWAGCGVVLEGPAGTGSMCVDMASAH